ncbi:hypothetical protein PHELEMICH_24 [Mycobacterium phage Phelemich]|uniref:Tail assembly chaperone n=2 Tax=Acadianvirus reprobate TaxID=1982903 RepID=S5YQW4_9CAUD|nr:hypothetical protein N847_gp24 [Mycobacterium phage Phelemich]YP_008409945.1 hypothetical protein REPROBATE_24 [Mycobacterium phage Reprobate]AGT12760.1 hypothetical protein REPROBATE_24 [Mycobacterium phage Reprobate]AGT13938.1 hypothetical protein PHELEMICH_24 [Mycobacterium phage Phelemich]
MNVATITIEGSISPAGGLARGERRTVQDTPEVREYVRKGFAFIVDERTDTEREADEQAEIARDALGVPARNASRDDWAEFLAAHPGGFVTEGKNRDQLIAEWDAYSPTVADE